MKNNIIYGKDIYSKIIFGAVCVILFLPIIVIPPAFHPSDWTRIIALKIILVCLSIFLLYLFFYKKNTVFYLPEKGWLFYGPIAMLGLYYLVMVISTVFSQDPRLSIFGSPARSGGIANLLFFILFSFFLAVFIKEEDWHKLIKVNFIPGVLSSLLAIRWPARWCLLTARFLVSSSTHGVIHEARSLLNSTGS